MMLRKVLAAATLLWFASGALAAPGAVVEALQAPAWLTRDGKRLPLGVGSELLLRFADGSRVKLGETASLKLEELAVRREAGRLLRATLKVLEGAFRFTTDVASRGRYRHEVDVQFTTLTAGIRGTDIWGRNFGDREIVVLIEGKITVSRGVGEAVEMKDAGTYYQAPVSGEPRVQTISAEQLNEWAQQTEVQKGRGAQSQSGRWKLTELLQQLAGSFLSRPDTIVISGPQMDFAIQLVLEPLVVALVEAGRRLRGAPV
ncbi:MAG: FecR domain-containing protein [Burkholderiales bacterium]